MGGCASGVTLLRFVRILRVVRVVRLAARPLQLVAGLRMLIVSIEESLHSLGWVLFVLAMQAFLFGVCVTQYVTAHKMKLSAEAVQEQHQLQEYWGSLDRSVLSLYQ